MKKDEGSESGSANENGKHKEHVARIHEELGHVLGHTAHDKVVNLKKEMEQKDKKLETSLEQIRSLNAEFFKVSD